MNENESLIANAGLNAEEFEGETVLLDVVRGLYFSLTGSAIELWRVFHERRSATEALDCLCLQLAGADRGALQEAIKSMCDNQLLVPAGGPPSDGGPARFVVTDKGYARPMVEVFSDLADLISIDPVHEVNAATGWPIRPAHFPDVG